jgi:hypothetical protein
MILHRLRIRSGDDATPELHYAGYYIAAFTSLALKSESGLYAEGQQYYHGLLRQALPHYYTLNSAAAATLLVPPADTPRRC